MSCNDCGAGGYQITYRKGVNQLYTGVLQNKTSGTLCKIHKKIPTAESYLTKTGKHCRCVFL